MAKIYIRFELIGSGNLDYRNIVSARLVKDRYTPYSELRASVVLNNSISVIPRLISSRTVFPPLTLVLM